METDPDKLQVRPYAAAQDFPLINAWWQARHGAVDDMPAAMLPPLGVVVEDGTGPCFALWCYEAAGVGVATLEWPVSRPGLTVQAARAALLRAVECLTHAAGQCWSPRGTYNIFRANVSPAMLRAIQDMGFRREYDHERVPVILVREAVHRGGEEEPQAVGENC